MAQTITRDQIAERIAAVFIQRGYEGATLAQLAEATGLGRASLYHHFPGGKAEMAAELLRRCVADLQRRAFRHLGRKQSPEKRLTRFIDGFAEYCQDGTRACLIAVLAQGSAVEAHGDAIHRQYSDWLTDLTRTFEASGAKPKRARREAEQLLAELYGSLLTSQLTGDVGTFKRAVNRLNKRFSG